MTSRRKVLTGLGVAGAGAALAAPAIAQDKRVLTMVTTWPRGLSGIWTGVERFAQRVSAMSGGALEIQAFAGGEAVAPFDSFNVVRAGEYDMYHACEYYWQSNNPAYNFFTTVPFGFTADEHTSWIRNGGGQALWDEIAAEYGLKSLLCGNTGVQMGGWYANPIQSAEDLKGLRIRIPGMAADIFRELGAEPVTLPGGAIPQALFSGEIDAVEWVGPYNDLDFGVQKVLQNYMYPGFHEPGTSTAVGFNLDVWNGLTEGQRLILETAAASENRNMLAEYTANSGQALKLMVAEYGTNVARFPDAVYAKMASLATEKISDIGTQSDFARRVVASFEDFRSMIVPYSNEISGKYVEARAQFDRKHG